MFHKALTEALSKRFKVVEEPGPETMRIQGDAENVMKVWGARMSENLYAYTSGRKKP